MCTGGPTLAQVTGSQRSDSITIATSSSASVEVKMSSHKSALAWVAVIRHLQSQRDQRETDAIASGDVRSTPVSDADAMNRALSTRTIGHERTARDPLHLSRSLAAAMPRHRTPRKLTLSLFKRDRKVHLFDHSSPTKSSSGVSTAAFVAAASRWVKVFATRTQFAKSTSPASSLSQSALPSQLPSPTRTMLSSDDQSTHATVASDRVLASHKQPRKRSSRLTTASESSLAIIDDDALADTRSRHLAHRALPQAKATRRGVTWRRRLKATQRRTRAMSAHALECNALVQPRLSESRTSELNRHDLHAVVFALLQSPSTFEGHICKRFLKRQQAHVVAKAPCPATAQHCLSKARDCVQDLVQFMLAFRLAHLAAAASVHLLETHDSDAPSIELATSVQHAVEMYFFSESSGAFATCVTKWCAAVATAPYLAAFERKRSKWQALPAASDAFALTNPSHTEQSVNIQRAIASLDAIDGAVTPSRKLACLMRAVQALNDHITLEAADTKMIESESARQRVCAADELLPLLIFALCRSRVRQPRAHCVAMQQLCSFASQHGEHVYYLTMLETAIEFIVTHNNAEEE